MTPMFFSADDPGHAWPKVENSQRDETKLSRKDLIRSVFQSLNRSGSGCLTFTEMKPFAEHTGILAGCIWFSGESSSILSPTCIIFHRCCQFASTLECFVISVSAFQAVLCLGCLAVGQSIAIGGHDKRPGSRF